MNRLVMRYLIPAFVLCAILIGSAVYASDSGQRLYPIIENGKYGFIDRQERVVIKPQFKQDPRGSYPSFSEGLIALMMPNKAGKMKCGYINTVGKVVIEPQFDGIGDFHESLAFIDHTGNLKFHLPRV